MAQVHQVHRTLTRLLPGWTTPANLRRPGTQDASTAAASKPLQLFGTDTEGAPHLDGNTEQLAQASLRMVRQAGRLVAQAQGGFVTAVLAARSAGCTWRQLGTAAGVPYQSLHRRFRPKQAANQGAQRARSGTRHSAATELRAPEVDHGN